MQKSGRKWIRRITVLCVLALLAVYFAVGIVRSSRLESTLYRLALPSKSGVTSTVRVAQISDLHRAVFSDNNQALVDLIASKSPDLIAATGDMIDKRTATIDATIDLFERLVKIAPVVYSHGNHELERGDVAELERALTAVGVKVLDNGTTTMTINGQQLRIGGLYYPGYLRRIDASHDIDILLCHVPYEVDVFAGFGVSLTLCGHTHGGQFRIPLLHIPLYAPGQGLFPKYTSGLYQQDGYSMIVSRGLGNSSFPFRVYNPPEVVLVDIAYIGSM